MRHRGLIRSLVWMTVIAHLIMIYGCTSTNHLTLLANEVPVGSTFKIAALVLKDGGRVTFDNNDGHYVEKTIEGKSHREIVGTSESKIVAVDPENVLEVKCEQAEANGTGSFLLGLLAGMPVGAGILVLIAALSISNE
jgi:hypothetical protein